MAVAKQTPIGNLSGVEVSRLLTSHALSVSLVLMDRPCSKPGCPAPAEASLTFDYAERLVVMGPLSPGFEPAVTDLCRSHAMAFVLPQGWTEMRHLDWNNDFSGGS